MAHFLLSQILRVDAPGFFLKLVHYFKWLSNVFLTFLNVQEAENTIQFSFLEKNTEKKKLLHLLSP